MSDRASTSDDAFASLLAAAQTGAGWACTQLWKDHAPAVAAFVRVRGSREPDDLTSEVFLAVFERLPTFRGDAAGFRSFVFSIAYRRLVDELRMRSRRRDTVELLADDDPRRSASAEAEAESRIGDQRVRALLNDLPPDQRDVMVLRIVADLTIDQMADIVGKRPAAVKALQRRALERLRKSVGATRTPIELAIDGRK